MDSHYELYRWDDPKRPRLDWSHLWDDTPFCNDCGETKNLTEYQATPGKVMYMCQRCKRDIELEGN